MPRLLFSARSLLGRWFHVAGGKAEQQTHFFFSCPTQYKRNTQLAVWYSIFSKESRKQNRQREANHLPTVVCKTLQLTKTFPTARNNTQNPMGRRRAPESSSSSSSSSRASKRGGGWSSSRAKPAFSTDRPNLRGIFLLCFEKERKRRPHGAPIRQNK